MRTPIVIFVCAGLALVAAPLVAQRSVSQSPVPAEQPPASFSSNQYVDSQGCVYIRVGRGEQTSWVPRVNRAREVVCGYRPSLSGNTQVATASAPATPTPSRVVDLTANMQNPAPTTRVAAPRTTTVSAAPTTTAIRTIAPSAAPVRTVTAPSVNTAIAQPRTSASIARTITAPAAVAAPAARTVNSGGCRWETINGTTILSQGRNPVRCGPQAVHPGDLARGQQGSLIGVGQSNYSSVGSVAAAAPAGFRPAWNDGRLNPARGPRSAAGDAQMNAIWTQTVPRELIQSNTVYAAPTVSSSNPRETTPRLRTTTSTRAPSASAPQGTRITANSAHRFVRAADFATRAEAEAAGRRLASQGLTARIGHVQRGGQTSYTILAGPYETSAALAQGLAAARSAGFPSATTR